MRPRKRDFRGDTRKGAKNYGIVSSDDSEVYRRKDPFAGRNRKRPSGRRFVYTLRKAVFVCFLRERRSARNRSPSLLHLKSGKNVNFSLPIRLERGIINGNQIYGFPYSDMIRLRSFTP